MKIKPRLFGGALILFAFLYWIYTRIACQPNCYFSLGRFLFGLAVIIAGVILWFIKIK